jgi:alpha-beta hydrolase superfamily lysophospholipase
MISLLACGAAPDEAPPPAETTSGVCEATDDVVTFETQDGVMLTADLQPAASANRGAVVLFHMIPPSNDRSGWPKRVRNAMNDLDLTVLNVDRRGAGDSEGDPQDAYLGIGGRRDAEAAVSFLLSGAGTCGVDADRIALIGASNGTTSTLDYAAGHVDDLPDVAGLAWLSPGSYTEAQFRIDDRRNLLEATPILWLFPTYEDWSLAFVDGAPDTWTFVERGAAHGTLMFDGDELEDDTVADLLAFLGGL